jgi:hypothetical protein
LTKSRIIAPSAANDLIIACFCECSAEHHDDSPDAENKIAFMSASSPLIVCNSFLSVWHPPYPVSIRKRVWGKVQSQDQDNNQYKHGLFIPQISFAFVVNAFGLPKTLNHIQHVYGRQDDADACGGRKYDIVARGGRTKIHH